MSRKAKKKRQVDWLVDLMAVYLKRLVAQRVDSNDGSNSSEILTLPFDEMKESIPKMDMVRDEVVESFTLKKYRGNVNKKKTTSRDPEAIEVDAEVLSQLHDYVSRIADCYRLNHFHSFEVSTSMLRLSPRMSWAQHLNHCRLLFQCTDSGALIPRVLWYSMRAM